MAEEKLKNTFITIKIKKLISILLICITALSLTACAGNVKGVKIQHYNSEVYTNSEIEDAIDVTLDYFVKEFKGCTLTELSYAGDDELKDYQEFADRNNADDVIVFYSSFDTGKKGGDGSLNPNYTYTGWNWILVRDNGGKWRHVDHRY